MLLPALKMKLLILSVLVIGGAIAGKELEKKKPLKGLPCVPEGTIELLHGVVKRINAEAVGNAAIAFWMEL
jgi:hypothetical protein